MQRPERKQDNVINHIRIGDVVHKSRQGLNGISPKVVELSHEFFSSLVRNGGG